MGAFYMQTDIEQYTLGFSYSFFKNKLHVHSDFGVQKNNLSQISVNNSSRTIGNASVSINPGPNFGLDLSYSNYGISQQIIPQLNNPSTIVRYDSVRISQVNQSFNFSPHLLINGDNVKHSLSLQASYQLLQNNNAAEPTASFTSLMSSLVYVIMLSNSGVNISNTINYFDNIQSGTTTSTEGYSLGVSKNFKKKSEKAVISNMNAGVYAGYFQNDMNGYATGHVLSLNPSFSMTFYTRHSLQLGISYSNTINNGGGGTNPNLLTYVMRYNVNF